MNKLLASLTLTAVAYSQARAVDKFSHGLTGSGSSITSYTETAVSGGKIGIDVSVSLGAGTGGRSTLTISPLDAGDTPIEWLNVTATSGTTNRYLEVSVSCPNFPTKRVSYVKSAQRTSGSTRPVKFGCVDVGQLGVSGSTTTFSFSSYAFMRVKKDVGESHTGIVYADIVATAVPSGETGATGNFEDPFYVEGDFLSSTTTPGYMNPFLVTGALGTTARPASVEARLFERINAASFEGEIDATGTSGTDGVGEFVVTGDVVGQIFAERVGAIDGWNGVWTIGGDLDADVVIRGDVDAESTASPATVVIGGEFKAGRVFVIGGTLAGGASGVGGIKVTDTAGLKGQIIVNANDTSDAWLGDATVGATVLDPGGSGTDFAYTTTSSTLGGGAVGLVPYHLHKTDCLPAYNETGSCEYVGSEEWPAAWGGEERQTIVLRHDGPVFDGADGQTDEPETARTSSNAGPSCCATAATTTSTGPIAPNFLMSTFPTTFRAKSGWR